jgi:hypothetical protein
MFIQNKYSKWYSKIIAAAMLRPIPAGYKEKHHIIPHSLGGKNSKDNLVYLTAREHFVCHMLLPKMLKGEAKTKMIFAAFHLLTKNTKQRRYTPTSRIYEQLKLNMSNAKKGKTAWNKGLPGIKTFTGCKHSDESKALMREKHSHRKYLYCNVCCKTFDKPNYTRYHGDKCGKEKVTLVCQYCFLKVSPHNYKRWHGSRCRLFNRDILHSGTS